MASDQTAPEATTAATPTNAATAAGGGGEYSNGKGTSTTKADPPRRRIVKAAPPKVVTNGGGGGEYSTTSSSSPVFKSNMDKNKDDDDALEGSNRGSGKHHHGKKHDPLVFQDDETESWREERLSRAQTRGKALREKELAERRKLTANQNANLSANPFSRFLSVFSVEPKHPEHKRSFESGSSSGNGEDGGEDNDYLKGPVEKRRRQSCDDNDNSDGSERSVVPENGSSSWGLMSNKWFWVSTAAAALAMGVAMALHQQRGRSSRK